MLIWFLVVYGGNSKLLFVCKVSVTLYSEKSKNLSNKYISDNFWEGK